MFQRRMGGIAGVLVLGWLTTTVFAGEKVEVEELQKIQERLRHLEEALRAKEERIRKLEEVLSKLQGPSPKAVQVAERQEVFPNGVPRASGPSNPQKEGPFLMGGEFALMPGGQSGPFGGVDEDFFIAGALDLPLFHRDPLLGQKLLGEVLIGYGRSTDEGVFTSPVTLFLPTLGLPPEARLVSNRLETKFLQVFLGAKYKLVDYGLEQLEKRVQPYVVTGLGLNVLLGRTTQSGVDVDGDGKVDVSLSSLGFPGGMIGGVIPEASELWERGFPTGQGNLKLAYSIGGGLDARLTERIFVGADLRYHFLDGGGDYGTYTGKVGFLW